MLTGLQSLATGINRLTDSLVHPALRSEPDVLHRARVLITLLLFINLVLSVNSVIVAVSYTSAQTRSVGMSMCLVLIAGNCLLLYILRRSGNYVFCSLATTMLAAMGIIFGIVVSGGVLQSPVTQLLVLPPLMVYFFAGRRRGTWAVLAALLSMALLCWFEQAQFISPVRIAADDADIARVLLAFLGVTGVSTMALIFERNASKLKRERDEEHQKTLLMAQTDALTGLANRRSFDAQLNARIGSAPSPRGFALCFIDLDGFKIINDRFGHAIGDDVLRVVAQRLRQSAREHDVIGRQGGDEFTVIFDALTNPDATGFTVDRMLALVAQPIDTAAGQLSVGVSAGVALYPSHGATAELLKRAADQAMYAAKQAGNQWRLFELADAAKESAQ